VAVRRTRVVLSHAKGVLPADVRSRFGATFEAFGLATGPARDLDVQCLGWADDIAVLDPADRLALGPVRAELVARREAAHVELARALGPGDLLAGLDSWRSWLAEPCGPADPPALLGSVVAARIRRAQRIVLRDGRKITRDSPPERLHQLRKDTKKLRYLLECFGGLLHPKRAKRFVEQLKVLQDNLGTHQDAEVHVAGLRQLGEDLRQLGANPPCDHALEQLIEHLDARRVRERKAFAKRFAAYDSRSNRRALDRLLAPLDEAAP
jgi:CHAD domain-containing protein